MLASWRVSNWKIRTHWRTHFCSFFGSCNENLPESQVFTAVATNGEWRMSLLRFGENSRKGLKMESFQEIDMVGSGKTMILL